MRFCQSFDIINNYYELIILATVFIDHLNIGAHFLTIRNQIETIQSKPACCKLLQQHSFFRP